MTALANGLSPRVRGNHLGGYNPAAYKGSIPACAGEPPGRPSEGQAHTVYPRVCGGTQSIMKEAIIPTGLSPRVRGNRSHNRELSVCGRSIPACAGEPDPD